jgi:oligopeptide transport system ATP-binding protein
MALLEVRHLETHFKTQDGLVKAVNDVSFHVDRSETLGIVGESGSGKSVTSLSIMRLVPSPPGKIVGGELIFDGENLLDMSEEEMRHIRGNRIAMIFQDPMTSLNPVLTIGRQITESLELHMKMSGAEARKRAVDLEGDIVDGFDQTILRFEVSFEVANFKQCHNSSLSYNVKGTRCNWNP